MPAVRAIRWGISLTIIGLIFVSFGTTVSAKTNTTPVAAPKSQLTNIIALAAGYDRTYALSADGTVWGWGDISLRYEGRPDNTLTPVNLTPVLGDATTIAASTGGQHDCAVAANGGVRCWGMNDHGELGNGSTEWSGFTPVEVVNLNSGITTLAIGFEHTCALTAEGRVKCWGNNTYGQLGDGTTTERHTPVDVIGLTGVKAIATGSNFTCALTEAGGVKCWGFNSDGELGDGTNTERHAPANVAGLTSGVKAISAGELHTCALTTAGGDQCPGESIESLRKTVDYRL